VSDFERRVGFLYDEADRRKGYIEVENRKGGMERFGPMTITIALVDSQSHRIEHVADGQGQLRHHPGPVGPHPALCDA
jgi:hypothetical protein